jgi:hypothetical protein
MAIGFFDRRRHRDETRGKKEGRGACTKERSRICLRAEQGGGRGRGGARRAKWSRIEVGNGDRFISMVLKLAEKRREGQARRLTERGVAKPKEENHLL